MPGKSHEGLQKHRHRGGMQVPWLRAARWLQFFLHLKVTVVSISTPSAEARAAIELEVCRSSRCPCKINFKISKGAEARSCGSSGRGSERHTSSA